MGKNNCGKTSILEAVELLLSGGSVAVLRESALRRGEFEDTVRRGVDVSHVFHGHRCTPGASFELSSSGRRKRLTGKILALDEIGDVAERWAAVARRRRLDADDEPTPAFGLSLVPDRKSPIVLPITEDGSLLDRAWAHHVSNGFSRREVRFLNFESSSMRVAWNSVLAEGRESEIVEAMRILMPEIDSIHFLAGGGRQGILVGQRNVKPRLPVGSYGEGMRRLLAISLALVSTRDGYLLIDEIDTGLHWTVMDEMWRLVVEAAERSNVQVFATTHSYDCIRGLGTLIRCRPDLADGVAIHKVHGLLDKSVRVAGKEIPIAMEQDIEVR